MNKYNDGKKPKIRNTQYLSSDYYVNIIGLRKLRSTIKFILGIIALFVVLGLVASFFYFNPRATIKDSHIQRTYSELLRCLDEEPFNFESIPYASTLPKEVWSDINRMLNSEEELDIKYRSSKNLSNIQIKKSSDKSGYKMLFTINGTSYYDNAKMNNLISMYKNGKNIVLYGCYGEHRTLERYEIDYESGDVSMDYLDNLDLYGKDIKPDETFSFNRDMSLIRISNDFMFYRFGKQIGDVVTFSGSKIKKFDYDYILDNKYDLYYTFYCADKDNTWIKFVKVDENIEKVTDDFVSIEFDSYGKVQVPIYVKGGKKYAGVANLKTLREYSLNYGVNLNQTPEDETDFNISVINISPEKAKDIMFIKKELSLSYEYDWYIRYYYEANGQQFYHEERVNGLDSYLTRVIPEETLQMFAEKSVSIEQVEEIVKELREIYKEYE